MANPTFVSVSALAASTAGISVTIPAHSANDLLMLVLETDNQTVATPTSTGLTWTQIASSPKTAAGTSTRLTIFTAVGDGVATTITVADPGDHVMGACAVFNHASGTPAIHAQASGESDGTAGVQTLPNVTTTVADCLIVSVGARGDDTAAQQFATSTWNNTPTPNYTEQLDTGSTQGDGGGLGLATRVQATAGTTNSVVTTARAVPTVFITIALSPPVASGSAVGSSSGTGAAAAVGSSLAVSPGSAAGTGAAAAVSASIAVSPGSAAGVGTATGIGASAATGVGASAGVGAAAAVGIRTAASPGAASGTGSAAGVSAAIAASPGAAAGTGTAAGVGASIATTIGAAAGVGAASGVGSSIAAAVGAASGQGSASGVGTTDAAGSAGAATGTGTASGVGASIATTVGLASGSGTASGIGASVAAGVGAASGAGTASGAGDSSSDVVEEQRHGGDDGTRYPRRSRHAGRRITAGDFDERQRKTLMERVHAAKMRHFMPAPPTAPAAEPTHVSPALGIPRATALERSISVPAQRQPSRQERERARVERDRLRQEQAERSAAVHKSSERIRQKRREQERQQARVNLLVLRNQQAVIALLLAA